VKLAEAWHLSRIPYREAVYRSIAEERGRMWWGAFGRSHTDKEAQGDIELTKRALRIAKFDKLVVAVFNVIASVIPFASLSLGSPPLGLTSSISLSLAITFGFTTLYAIQTLSSFVSTEPSALLSTIPLAKDDFSLITLFSFIRSVDYMIVGSILSQIMFVAYLTASPLATLLMFVASLTNAVFAVTIALWFSRLFYTNLLRGGRSKVSTALRLVFILMWGTLLVGVGFLFSVPWYIVPHLERTLLSLDQIPNLFFSIVYPFSAGIAIANLVYHSATFSTALTASVAMTGYVMLAGVAGRWSLGMVKRISEGTGVKTARAVAKDFSIKTRNPLIGYVMKDLRISSRNPATAFFFALPVLETVIVSLLITNYETLRASTMLVATATGGVFALFMPLALLNAEGTGLEYTKTLPVNVNRIIVAKTLISTATYAPVPLTLLGMTFMKQLTSPLTILIPYITILAIASASVFEIKLFLSSATRGRIASLTRDLEKLIAGVMATLIPEAVYTITYLISFDHIFAVLIMGGTGVIELAMAVYLLRRS
jgi:predicted permease